MQMKFGGEKVSKAMNQNNDKKKVVGFSFGRKMSNTEVMIKEALLQCEEAGMDIQFVRCDDLNIHICTGCCACVGGLMSGRGRGTCIHKDDEFYIIEEALMSADAVIVGSPTYEFAPTGNFKVVCDRIGPSHDKTFRGPAIEAGMKEGRSPETYPDVRSTKPRVGALITVGGARTENWLSLSLPNMFEFTMPMGIDVIDKYKYFGAMNVEHVLGRPAVMDRMKKLGQNIVEALNAETEEERVRYRGDEEGVCPVCHEDILTVSHNGNKVECPICGIEGELTVQDGKIKVVFSEEQQKRSRLYDAGKWEHSNEIRDGAMAQKKVEGLKELKKKYAGVGETAK